MLAFNAIDTGAEAQFNFQRACRAHWGQWLHQLLRPGFFEKCTVSVRVGSSESYNIAASARRTACVLLASVQGNTWCLSR